jgi:hypothetical protein
MNNPSTHIATSYLIDLTSELIRMTPNPSDWNEEILSFNPPRLLRYKRINAMLDSYFGEESGITIEKFINGDFIQMLDIDYYLQVIIYMNQYLKSNNLNQYNDLITYRDLQLTFSSFFKYKCKLNDLFWHNSENLCGGGKGDLFSSNITESISAELVEITERIDTTLEYLINPMGIIRTEFELVLNYGYPSDDLDKIDGEWI